MNAELCCGDALDVLASLPERSVRCCVTSPPYWGLRDYGTAAWDGGDPDCDHLMSVSYKSSTLGASTGGRSQETHARSIGAQATPYSHTCGKCGARRIDRQLGLESTPEEYVARMVAVFREVRRVLTDDGTLWLNLGDSYAGSGKGAWDNKNGGQKEVYIPDADSPQALLPKVPSGLKPKDLVGIPWRLALALQADGWWLRSDIIWAKPNPMPESVTDRPTKSHEYVFLLSKSERYYYDAAAIAEEAADLGRVGEDVGRWGNAMKPSRAPAMGRRESGNEASAAHWVMGPTRNARTVWTIATQPYPDAHFATFPEELARRCILAGTAPGDRVLDPFGGSGTVAAVAVGNGRRSVYIDLNPAYLELARQRIGPVFCTISPTTAPDGVAALHRGGARESATQ